MTTELAARVRDLDGNHVRVPVLDDEGMVPADLLPVADPPTAEINAAVDAAVAALIAGAPGALDTLNELAAALGDDANFAATVSAALADKIGLSDLANLVAPDYVVIRGGNGDEISVELAGGNGIDGGEGGYAQLTGGNGDTGEQGAGASLQGGGANGGADVNKLGASINAAGGNMGGHGKVTIQTDGSQGEAGQVFTADGAGAATWEDAATGGGFMGATAWNSVAQSIPNATDTVVTLDSEEADTNAIHSIASATSRFTVPVGGAGRWAGIAYIPWAASGSGSYRYIWWKKNGTRILGTLTSSGVETGPGQDQQNALRPMLLADGDYLEAEVRHDTGGALNIGLTGDQRVVVAVWRVG